MYCRLTCTCWCSLQASSSWSDVSRGTILTCVQWDPRSRFSWECTTCPYWEFRSWSSLVSPSLLCPHTSVRLINRYMSTMGEGWTAFRLQRLGQWNEANTRTFPLTTEIIRGLNIPLAVRGVMFAKQVSDASEVNQLAIGCVECLISRCAAKVLYCPKQYSPCWFTAPQSNKNMWRYWSFLVPTICLQYIVDALVSLVGICVDSYVAVPSVSWAALLWLHSTITEMVRHACRPSYDSPGTIRCDIVTLQYLQPLIKPLTPRHRTAEWSRTLTGGTSSSRPIWESPSLKRAAPSRWVGRRGPGSRTRCSYSTLPSHTKQVREWSVLLTSRVANTLTNVDIAKLCACEFMCQLRRSGRMEQIGRSRPILLILISLLFYRTADNNSAEDRYVVIIDFWHPELTPEERVALDFVYDTRNKFETGTEDSSVRAPTSNLLLLTHSNTILCIHSVTVHTLHYSRAC